MSPDICLTYVDAIFLVILLLLLGAVIGRLTLRY